MENRKSRGMSPHLKTLAAALSVALAGGVCGSFSDANASPHSGPPNKANGTSHAKFHSPKYDKLRAEFDALRQSARPTQPHAPTTRTVSSRNDNGAGSLRDALSNAVDGDVIDLRNVHGTISLAGALQTSANVEIRGPGRDLLTIDAAGQGRVFSASHGLRMSNVTIANGAAPKTSATNGGCLFVAGRLYLDNVSLTGCKAGDETTPVAYGGAISVGGELYLNNVSITNSSATGYYAAIGGGVAVIGNATDGYYSGIYNSTISGNAANVVSSPYSYLASGGGVNIVGSQDQLTNPSATTISGSTISGNSSVNQSPSGGYAQGGGINIQGATATIAQSQITGNTASGYAFITGGGVSIGSPLTVDGGSFSGNSSVASSYGYSYGGGIAAFAPVTIDRASIQNNTAAGFVTVGGGIGSLASIVLTNSVVTGNTAGSEATYVSSGGGIGRKYSSSLGPGSTTITNSTLSGNAGTGSYSIGGGVYEAKALTLNNTTVAFNTTYFQGGGVTTNKAATITLNSTIISNNTATNGATSADLFAYGGPITVSGDHNLIIASDSGVTLPGDTLTADPLLQPLADNGGGTLTHALDPASPAVDTGSNPLSLPFDQRGTPYARQVGAAADIGAYELDTDRIFANGFE